MNVKGYSLKLTQLSNFDLSFLSNLRDEMSRFLTGVSDLVKEECRTAMLRDDMNLSRLIVYSKSIEETKLKRMNRDVKRGRSNEQGPPRFKKRDLNQDFSSALKGNQERVGRSQVAKATCLNYGKIHSA